MQANSQTLDQNQNYYVKLLIQPAVPLSPTPTLTATPTPILASTKISTPLPRVPPSVYIISGLILIIVSVVSFIIISNTRSRKVQLSPIRAQRESIEEEPPLIYKPIKKSEKMTAETPIELSDELLDDLKILRELYEDASKAKNDVFVSISDLEILLKQKYPQKKVDLLKVAIEIANTQDGLLKIQQAREEIYLIQVL